MRHLEWLEGGEDKGGNLRRLRNMNTVENQEKEEEKEQEFEVGKDLI